MLKSKVMHGHAILSCMIFFSWITASVFTNKVSPPFDHHLVQLMKEFGLGSTLIIGTSGYAVFSASLYQNHRYGTEWFVLFRLRMQSKPGLMIQAEAAIKVSYPES
jgi:hypothetical protein